MRKLKIITLIVAFASLTVALSIKLNAQVPTSSFAISPPSFDFNANPGDVIKNSIRVENLSDFPINITAKPENFIAYGDTGQVALTEEDTSYAIDKWINLPVNVITISPKESAIFDFVVNVPKNTEPGSHYGAIVFSTITPQNAETTGAIVQQEIGALILIKIPGDVIEEARLESFSSKEQVYTNTDLTLTALIENTGTLHFKPVGRIYIKDLFGNVIQTIEVQSKNILPKNKRVFEENFKFEGIGYFKAELELFYKNGEKVIRGETNFTSLNLSKSIPILLIIGGVIAAYILFKKRINKALMIIIKG